MGGRLIAIAALTLALVVCSSSSVEDPEAAVTRAVTDFFAKAAPGSTVEVRHIGEPGEDYRDEGKWRPFYDPSLSVVSDDGTDTRVRVEIHAERFYITWYSLLERPSGEGDTIDREQALAIGRAFAEAQFPNWGDHMRLAWLAEPRADESGIDYYQLKWEGELDGTDTGDYVWVTISTAGTVLVYVCNAAVPHTRDEVKVPRWRAVMLVLSMIRERSEFDMSQLKIEAELVLSHPILEDEGPAWIIRATRTVPGTWPGTMTLRWFVDARTREVNLGLRHDCASVFYAKEWLPPG